MWIMLNYIFYNLLEATWIIKLLNSSIGREAIAHSENRWVPWPWSRPRPRCFFRHVKVRYLLRLPRFLWRFSHIRAYPSYYVNNWSVIPCGYQCEICLVSWVSTTDFDGAEIVLFLFCVHIWGCPCWKILLHFVLQFQAQSWS